MQYVNESIGREIIMLPQIENLKTDAKAKLLYAKEEKKFLFDSKTILAVSVGKAEYEGIKFSAIVDLINKNFSHCDIMVCDSLQRHTLEIHEDLSKEEYHKKANTAGDQWIERNSNALNSIQISHQILRWDSCLANSNFNKLRGKIYSLYQEEPEFTRAMHETIETFIARHKQYGHIKDEDKAFNSCFNFLIEECTVVAFIWPKLQYNYILYPGKMLNMFEFIFQHQVGFNSQNTLKWLCLYVRTRSSNFKQKPLFTPDKTLAYDDENN
jgi:tRNA-dependent cyclodipeptide synthase